jgi:hypothetical protein
MYMGCTVTKLVGTMPIEYSILGGAWVWIVWMLRFLDSSDDFHMYGRENVCIAGVPTLTELYLDLERSAAPSCTDACNCALAEAWALV